MAGGALVAGMLVFGLAPEAEGHGTDAAIEAVHTNPTGIRPRAVAVKLVASMLTIGSGGSGGREGPTAQISAGFGSALARRLHLTTGDARICVTAGMSAVELREMARRLQEVSEQLDRLAAERAPPCCGPGSGPR